MQHTKAETPMKNIFNILLKKDQFASLTVRSDFDSGNIGKAQLGINNTIIITPAHDCAGTIFQSHAKGWFYFSVKGAPLHFRLKFVVKKMSQLTGQSKFSQYFKPVYRYVGDDWGRVQNAMTFTKEDDTELHFEFRVEKSVEVFFAYSFPFGFQECERMLKTLSSQFKTCKGIYYKDEVLIRSPEGRPLHLITISSNDQKLCEKEDQIHENLFEGNYNGRAMKFGSNKKIVMITARVHPGETPSSHTMNGILKFLLSKDARAHCLRKNFVFKIVPMINPDGVYNGHYRMDIFNQNLNRHYLNPEPFRHPSAFAIRTLGEYYKASDRLVFYLDLHAHPQKKGNFIYGNALDSQLDQIQTQLFPKLLSLNCVQFDYDNSSFAKKEMNSKDRNDQFTKEGCGRVVFNKILGQTYAYTMQCGYTMSTYLNELVAITNPHRKYQKHGVIIQDIQNVKSNYYARQAAYFTIKSYQGLGKAIMVSLLDLFEINVYSRVPNTQFKHLAGVRKEIQRQITKVTKDYKPYAKGILLPLGKTPLNSNKGTGEQYKKHNYSSFTGKSLPKRPLLVKNNLIFKSQAVGKARNRTLPKMKG